MSSLPAPANLNAADVFRDDIDVLLYFDGALLDAEPADEQCSIFWSLDSFL